MWILAQDGTAYNREVFATIEIRADSTRTKFTLVAHPPDTANQKTLLAPGGKVLLGTFSAQGIAHAALMEILTCKEGFADLTDPALSGG